MVYTLYGCESNPRTRVVAIVAAIQKIPISRFEIDPMDRSPLLEEFPRSSGKIPALKGPEGLRVTEVMAICVYLAKKNPSSTMLMGDGSPEQEAEVLSWMSWANQELESTLAKWFLPLIPNLPAPPCPYNQPAIEAGKKASLSLLQLLEDHLRSSKDRAYLVGNHLSLADIFVAILLQRAFEMVLDANWRQNHPNCMRHFEMVVALEAVRKVVSEGFRFIEVETPIVNPYE